MNTAASPIHKTLDRKQSNRRIAQVIWRWALVLVAAFCVAEIVFTALGASKDTAISLATTGVAVTVIVAVFADLMGLFHACAAYLRGKTESLASATPGFWKAWASLTAVFLSIHAWARPADPVPDPWFVVYSSSPSSGPSLQRRAMFPVLYANSAGKNWKTGVSFTSSEIDVSLPALRRIFAGYKDCGSVPGEPAVQLEIAGYASSKEFEGKPLTESNLLNVEVANRRAWAAYCFVADQADVQLTNADIWSDYKCENNTESEASRPQIMVSVKRWPKDELGFDAMMQARPLEDRPPGMPKDERDPEELTRRVDFSVIHAGGCQKSVPPTNQMAATVS